MSITSDEYRNVSIGVRLENARGDAGNSMCHWSPAKSTKHPDRHRFQHKPMKGLEQ